MTAEPGGATETRAAFPSPPNPQAENSEQYTRCESVGGSPDFPRGGTVRMDSTCCRQRRKIKEARALDEGGTPMPSSRPLFLLFSLN